MRLIVLTSDRFATASDCLPAIHKSHVCSVARVVISRDQSPNRLRLWRRKLKKISQIGVLGAVNGIRMQRSWYHPDVTDLVLLCGQFGIRVFETDITNSDETVRLFEDACLDLGLSLGNGYILPRVFSVPRYGMINVHGERLPEYQNAQSVILPIYLETTTGLTIHQIERSIDTGKILYREEYPIIFCKTLEQTVRKTIGVTQQRAAVAVRYVCDNYEALLRQARTQEGGQKFTTPSIRQFYRMVRNNAILYERSRNLSPSQISLSGNV